MSELKTCEAFLSWQENGKQSICGRPASFVRRTPELTSHLCAEHAHMTYQLQGPEGFKSVSEASNRGSISAD